MALNSFSRRQSRSAIVFAGVACGVAVSAKYLGLSVLLPAFALIIIEERPRGWLAVVNTAFAFTLWNHTLRTLTAIESNVMNNTMLIQIALLAWIFLGESLNGRQLLGIALAVVGIAIVQLAPLILRRRSARL